MRVQTGKRQVATPEHLDRHHGNLRKHTCPLIWSQHFYSTNQASWRGDTCSPRWPYLPPLLLTWETLSGSLCPSSHSGPPRSQTRTRWPRFSGPMSPSPKGQRGQRGPLPSVLGWLMSEELWSRKGVSAHTFTLHRKPLYNLPDHWSPSLYLNPSSDGELSPVMIP